MKYIFTIILCYVSLIAYCQQFGGNRFGTQWRQINNDTLRIIFPKGTDTLATRVANIIHRVANNNHNSLGKAIKKVNVVLQPQTTIANGYVGLGPYRSEFYLTPPADNFEQGSLYWPDQLALHEYRHVQQYNNFNKGFSRWMYRFFGEQAYALAINASVPGWFLKVMLFTRKLCYHRRAGAGCLIF